MNVQHVLINGDLVPAPEARLHVSDLGLLRGYGVFDFFRVLGGQPLFLADYLERFQRSARLVGLTPPLDAAGLEREVTRLIAANRAGDAGCHLLLTGGESEDGFAPTKPALVMQLRALRASDSRLYRDGARLLLHEHRRELPEAKTTNYLTALRLLGEQQAQGAVDILYHWQGRVLETARSNVFALRADGVLVTPGRGVLAGVTRKHLLELARTRYRVLEADLSLAELFAAREVFISSSLKGVMPVVGIGERTIGSGRPGEVALALAAAFQARVAAYLGAPATGA